MNYDGFSPEITTADFERVRNLVYDTCGIDLHEGKSTLIRTRLAKRVRELQLPTITEYLELVTRDSSGEEARQMIDILTTNKTSFFRESQHFDFLKENVFPKFSGSRRPFLLWSAGCSSGQEPFSLAIAVQEELGPMADMSVRILATDISKRMLDRARAAAYDADDVSTMPPQLVSKYFVRSGSGPTARYTVNDKTRKMVRFARLNLMEPWPMRGPFDVIFCRNVMIYFSKEVQAELIRRYRDLIRPEGFLFVGHSESLSAFAHGMVYSSPAVYMRSSE